MNANPEHGETQEWRLIPVEVTPEMIGAMAVVESSMTVNGKPTLGMSGAQEAFDAMVEALPPAPSIADIVAAMSDTERVTLFSDYCLSCGSDDPKCQCWNDE